jgi:hypothetical protein
LGPSSCCLLVGSGVVGQGAACDSEVVAAADPVAHEGDTVLRRKIWAGGVRSTSDSAYLLVAASGSVVPTPRDASRWCL